MYYLSYSCINFHFCFQIVKKIFYSNLNTNIIITTKKKFKTLTLQVLSLVKVVMIYSLILSVKAYIDIKNIIFDLLYFII